LPLGLPAAQNCPKELKGFNMAEAGGASAADANAGGTTEREETRDDYDELLAFVYELRDLLRRIVEDGRFIPPDWADDVQAAWPRVERRFAELISTLKGQNITLADLDRHGLTGEELDLKLRGWRARIFAFGRRINRRWVRSVLRWADMILGSLAAVFAPAGAIKEFKEVLENFIEEAEAEAKGG
jgi:hypothetical protein